MKKALLILLLAVVMPFTTAWSQNVILGEKVPEIKPAAWLENRQPAAAQLTYVEFFQVANKSCTTSLDKLKKIADKMGARLRIIVVTQEKDAATTSALTPYLSSRIGVALDTPGKIFAAYGVNYLPFGVLIDAKNRALWMGNSLQLNEQLIDKVAH